MKNMSVPGGLSASGKYLYDIILLCLKIDIVAYKFYLSLSKKSPNPNLKEFWIDIAEDEKSHIVFWRKTLELAEKGILPQIFDNPGKIKREIQKSSRNIDKVILNLDIGKDEIADFLAAFHVEFYGMHPGLAPLFNVMKIVSEEVNPEDAYDKHIIKFLRAFNKYCGRSHNGIKLLGETLLQLWNDNRRLSAQCYTDELTTVLNRRGFFKVVMPLMELARRNKKTVALLLADIDRFKQINDTCGHLVGDQLLGNIHKIFRKSIRASDLVCRFGGDEFIVFCPEIKPGASVVIAENLRKAVSRIKFKGLRITLSIGCIETVPQKKNADRNLENIIRAADNLLYKVKETGRNNVLFKNS